MGIAVHSEASEENPWGPWAVGRAEESGVSKPGPEKAETLLETAKD